MDMGNGVALDEFCERYPVLYHMAWDGSWPTIRRHGLLSTSALLDVYQVKGRLRTAIESKHRPRSIRLTRDGLLPVVVRDQHPMSEAALRRCLTGGLTPRDWYRILNARVFFWLTEDRLLRMMGSPSYARLPHTVLTLDTRSVASAYWPKVRFAAMNTGCTVPFAHPRGRETFLRPKEFPWEKRKRLGGDAVVEFTIEGGVTNVETHLIRKEDRPPLREPDPNQQTIALNFY